jgi:two-component sensor histidine kinase
MIRSPNRRADRGRADCSRPHGSVAKLGSAKELRLDVENANLRQLLAQAGIDAAEQKVMEGLQRLLLEELHHRIKNVLATVMVIASQSLRNADSVEHGRKAIEHRLLALGRVHDLLLKTNWTSAKLSSIVQIAIEPFDRGARFLVKVPDIDVSPAAVLPLAMILNELCTNAVKYGALSNANGCVAISAAVDPSKERFGFTWIERGGPTVQTPTRQSFGTRLIEHGFVGELRGEAHLSFEPSGVVCKLDIPLASLVPEKPTDKSA